MSTHQINSKIEAILELERIAQKAKEEAEMLRSEIKQEDGEQEYRGTCCRPVYCPLEQRAVPAVWCNSV